MDEKKDIKRLVSEEHYIPSPHNLNIFFFTMPFLTFAITEKTKQEAWK